MIGAGERAPTCASAAAAMRAVLVMESAAFAEARALERDRWRLDQAAPYIGQHAERYDKLDTRMAALADRCGDDPAVMAVFRDME